MSSPTLKTRLRWRVEFGAFYTLFLLARPVPRSWLLAFGRGLGSFIWKFAGFRKKVVTENIRHAFSATQDETWIQATAHSFYRNLGMTLMEFLASPYRTNDDVLKMVTLEGQDHIDEVLERGRGALMVSGHFGNFEMLLPRVVAEGHAVSGVVKAQSNPLVDAFQNRIRTNSGMKVIKTGGAFPSILRSLRQGDFVGLLADQDAGGQGHFTEFMGRQASVFKGAAILAHKAQCPIITGHIFRQPNGDHVVRVDPLIIPDPELEQEEAVKVLTEQFVSHLEKAIHTAPDQYYWIHRRWKTQPPVQPEIR
jgi:Kdo2-lipid IVA lauroyltransferase/acyltransferase